MGRRRSGEGRNDSGAPTLDELEARYLEDLVVRNYSSQTIKTKTWQLRRFETWCSERSIATAVE